MRNPITEKMLELHPCAIFNAIYRLGVGEEAHAMENEYQRLYDAGELIDVMFEPLTLEESAESLFVALCNLMREAFVSSLNKDEAEVLVNVLYRSGSKVKLFDVLEIDEAYIRMLWNDSHPYKDRIYIDTSLLPSF